jgi:hypothetical protein
VFQNALQVEGHPISDGQNDENEDDRGSSAQVWEKNWGIARNCKNGLDSRQLEIAKA